MRTWRLLLAAGALLLGTGVASAGEYHRGSTLVCNECHTMHFSMTHGWAGATVVGTAPGSTPATRGDWLGTGGPHASLLKDTGAALCLACHDGQDWAPDVRGANTGTHNRQAGALTQTDPYQSWKGHTMGGSPTPPGGSVRVVGFQCANCHEPHGSAYFRNLANTSAQVSYVVGATNITTRAVWLRSWTLGDIATNYAESNVDFNEPDAQKSAMGKFCQGCHTDFHGAQGDSNMGGSDGTKWLRHPTAGANIGAVGGSSLAQFSGGSTRVKVMSPDGVWGPPNAPWSGAPTNLTPSCFSCHKAHGNQNPFGLIFLSRNAATVTEEGGYASGQIPGVDTGLRNLCGQCHEPGN
jgi:hypothetical protein